MKFSMLFASGALALVAVVCGAQAYGNQNVYPLNARYNSNGCGYDCRNSLGYRHQPQPGARSTYGPYHTYAVRPAIYGGHGMYHYRGYARHPLPPANAHYRRVVRSHPAAAGASRYQARGRSPARHPAGNGRRGHYGLRPVKALVLAPAYSGNSTPLYPAAARANRGYGAAAAAARGHRGNGNGNRYNGNQAARHHRPAASNHHQAQRHQYQNNGAARYNNANNGNQNRGGHKGASGGY